MSDILERPTTLLVNEVFDTMQGEATHTGTPATFLRLQGCGVGCPWCDTKHTWSANVIDEVTPGEMMSKTRDAPTHAVMFTWDVIDMLRARLPRAVVITGGEPCNHDLRALTGALSEFKDLVQVETSGTQPIQVSSRAWVTLSPKVGMPGGFVVREDAVARANEIKWPVGRQQDVDALRLFIRDHALEEVPIWLQPLSRNPKATALCVAAATEHGWKISVQVHALIGVR